MIIVSDTTPISELSKIGQLNLLKDILGTVIILAEELKADQLLIDEKAGRKVALKRGLLIIGLVGTIILAKEKGLIENVQNILDELISKGTRISPKLYNYALIIAKEI